MNLSDLSCAGTHVRDLLPLSKCSKIDFIFCDKSVIDLKAEYGHVWDEDEGCADLCRTGYYSHPSFPGVEISVPDPSDSDSD